MDPSNPDYSDTGASAFSPININGLAQSAVQAFGIYTAGQTANKAVAGLTPQTLTYVILGLGGLAVVALLVFKH